MIAFSCFFMYNTPVNIWLCPVGSAPALGQNIERRQRQSQARCFACSGRQMTMPLRRQGRCQAPQTGRPKQPFLLPPFIFIFHLSGCGPVGRALDLGSRCREFESPHSDHKSRKSICSLGFYLLNARLEQSNATRMSIAADGLTEANRYLHHQCRCKRVSSLR